MQQHLHHVCHLFIKCQIGLRSLKLFAMHTHYSSTDRVYHEPSCSLNTRRERFFFGNDFAHGKEWVIIPGIIIRVSESLCWCSPYWFKLFWVLQTTLIDVGDWRQKNTSSQFLIFFFFLTWSQWICKSNSYEG